MCRELSFSLLYLFGIGCAVAEQTAAHPPDPATGNLAARPVVHYAGSGVTIPELISSSQQVDSPQHCKKIDGAATLSVVVDTEGRPHDVFFLHPIGTDLDRMAIDLVTSDRFKPGTVDGAPASVAVADEVKVQACVDEQKDSAGNKLYSLELRSAPEQKLAIQSAPVSHPSLSPSIRFHRALNSLLLPGYTESAAT